MEEDKGKTKRKITQPGKGRKGKYGYEKAGSPLLIRVLSFIVFWLPQFPQLILAAPVS